MTVSEVQEKLLALLVAFDGYCSAHGLTYTLLAGSLLGAVRHGGFIPWDDDVDVAMPRPDFDRLVEQAKRFRAETPYRLVGHLGIPLRMAPLLKVVDDAVLVQPANEPAKTPLWLDISPLDALSDDTVAMGTTYRRAHVWQAALNFLGSTPQSGHTRMRRFVKRVAAPLRYVPAARRFCAWRLDAVARKVPWGSTGSLGSVAWGLGGVRERLSASAFFPLVHLEFEGRPFAAMGCWEQYLTALYGPRYMDMPDARWRVSHLAGAWRAVDGAPMTIWGGDGSCAGS